MRINPQALDRVKGSRPTGDGMATIFEHLRGALQSTGDTAVLSMSLDYQKDGDEVQEGDLIPVISFGLRPATLLKQDAEPNLDVHSGPVAEQRLP
jgi:hypothetical protein